MDGTCSTHGRDKKCVHYNEVLSGYQPGQVVKQSTRTEMVFEKLFFSPFNHLTPLIARENFIILIHWESNRS
jgi:hypothetical protein